MSERKSGQCVFCGRNRPQPQGVAAPEIPAQPLVRFRIRHIARTGSGEEGRRTRRLYRDRHLNELTKPVDQLTRARSTCASFRNCLVQLGHALQGIAPSVGQQSIEIAFRLCIHNRGVQHGDATAQIRTAEMIRNDACDRLRADLAHQRCEWHADFPYDTIGEHNQFSAPNRGEDRLGATGREDPVDVYRGEAAPVS